MGNTYVCTLHAGAGFAQKRTVLDCACRAGCCPPCGAGRGVFFIVLLGGTVVQRKLPFTMWFCWQKGQQRGMSHSIILSGFGDVAFVRAAFHQSSKSTCAKHLFFNESL